MSISPPVGIPRRELKGSILVSRYVSLSVMNPEKGVESGLEVQAGDVKIANPEKGVERMFSQLNSSQNS